MKVQRDELKLLFNLLVDKLELLEIDEIQIDLSERDLYWVISDPEWIDMSKIPNPEVGSFTDDWCKLKNVLKKESPTTFVDFDRAASILHLISAHLNPVDKEII